MHDCMARLSLLIRSLPLYHLFCGHPGEKKTSATKFSEKSRQPRKLELHATMALVDLIVPAKTAERKHSRRYPYHSIILRVPQVK